MLATNSLSPCETQGPLRSYDDEENKKFLDEVKEGYIPKELIVKHKNGKLNLEMADRKDTPYKEKPKPKYIAFAGGAQTLGGPSSSTSSTSVQVEEGFEVKVSLSQPVTQIQIRLSDNSRVVQKFNCTHKVGDLRKLIAQKRSGGLTMISQLHAEILGSIMIFMAIHHPPGDLVWAT